MGIATTMPISMVVLVGGASRYHSCRSHPQSNRLSSLRVRLLHVHGWSTPSPKDCLPGPSFLLLFQQQDLPCLDSWIRISPLCLLIAKPTLSRSPQHTILICWCAVSLSTHSALCSVCLSQLLPQFAASPT